jgi:predicted hotdog family 3-hydroxylacyl-ACP dehydratase
MAQATAVFDGISRRARGKKPKIGFLLGTRRLELMCDFFVFGMELLVKAERIWDGESVTQYKCKISDLSSGGVLSSANLTVYSPSVQSETDND